MYKDQHEELKEGEELGTFEIYISLTGKEKGLAKNQLAALRNPTKCVVWQGVRRVLHVRSF